MSQKQKPNLAAALAEAGGATRRRSVNLRSDAPVRVRVKKRSKASAKPKTDAEGGEAYQAPSRAGTAPITVHLPEQVRDQLKILAIEQKSTLHGVTAEAFNDLFAKYGKPEIAPHQSITINK